MKQHKKEIDNTILIIIPCYNEEQNILATVNNLKNELNRSEINAQILVVNDCSTDNSVSLIKSISDIEYIDLPVNLGIGGAMQTGFLYAKKNNYTIAIQFDGDGQHPENFINELIKPIQNKEADVVIGSRYITKQGFQSSFLRRLGIKYFSFLGKILLKKKVLDVTSGFRAINSKTINAVCNYYPEKYPEPESLILYSLKGLVIKEVPVIMTEREGGKSSIRGIYTLLYIFNVTLGMLFLYLRLNLSLKK